jgi:hypothetical protein
MEKTSFSKKGVFNDHSTQMDRRRPAHGLDVAGCTIHARVLQTISKNHNQEQVAELKNAQEQSSS